MKDRPAKEPGVKKESAWDQYLEIRENRRAARAAGGYKDDSKKQTDPSKDGFTGISNSIEDIKRQSAAIDKKKKTQKEEWKPDPTEKRKAKSAKLGREEEIEKGKSKKYGRDEGKIKDLYKRRMAVDFKKKKSSIGEDFVAEADLVDAGRENQGERDGKKLTGKGVDNKSSIKLMPNIDESILTTHGTTVAQQRLRGSSEDATVRESIRDLFAEECCPDCGTPECSCDKEKKEEKPKKKKMKIDESGMPIFETDAESRNNARPGPSKDMIDPPADPLGPPGHMNPKGEPKRYKEAGEAPGDRRPNRKKDKSLPNEDGTVPNGSGV